LSSEIPKKEYGEILEHTFFSQRWAKDVPRTINFEIWLARVPDCPEVSIIEWTCSLLVPSLNFSYSCYMEPLAKQIAKEFQERFHRVPVIVCAPGRINLIGEHVDYNDGYVLPAAIDKHLMFAIARNDIDKSTIISRDLQEEVSFTPDQRAPGEKWINYFMGVVEGFDRRGIKLGGVDCVFGGTIPKGAGLSSSAALCCGF